jgi:alpha-1,3-mannosyl-glycoprotein beta-1,2-N-acetylglucosaminyltransferase
MMSRALWTELKPKWPAGFWDDWLREPEQRRGRACIRPEMNRVFTFGAEGGASGGQFYHEYLATIQLNSVAVDWQHKTDLVSQLTKVRVARAASAPAISL